MVSRRRQSLPLRGMVNRLEVSFFSLIGQARPPGWLLAWVAGLCTLLHASAATLVVPPDSRAFDAGAASGAGDLVHPVHIQTVYPSRMFDGASVLLISELRYRPSSFYGTAFDSILTGVQIRLSTGIGPGEPPLAIFASNRGVDDTLVYDGDAALASAFESGPGNTKNFDIRFPLQTPFLYRPALGSLVVEFSHPAAGATSPIDVVGVTDGGGRVFSVDPSASSGNSDTGCDVLELVYSTPEEPPSWVSLPTSQRVPAGTNLVWSAIVSGSPPLAFQWFFQGQLLNGATSSVLRLPNVSRQQAGEYWLTVTNPHGGLTSSVVQLEVVEFPRVPVVVEPLGPSSRRTALVLSEIMYHPPDDGSGLNLEFIEVHNSGDVPVKLDGYRLSGAVDFTFPEGTTLEPHAFEVIAGNSTALQSRYPAVKPVGDFIGSLPNDSGTIRLRNRSGAVLLEVEYEDDLPWPVAADGGGHSLFLARPSYGEGEAAAWSPSPTVGGSPGQPEIVLSDLSERVFFNEILLGPTGTQDGFVELGSQSERSVDLSGWILTDDASTPKLRLPAGTVLPATGFLAIPHAQLGFGLKVEGGRLLLLKPEGDRVVDALRYRFLRPGIAWGRQPDGHTLLGELAVPSPGRPNAGQLPASVVINEILYRSLSGDPDDQFLEVYNRSETTVDLTGGRVTGDVNFSFPDQTKLPPREYLVLARNRTRLLSRYPTLNPAVVYGDFGGE